MAASSAVSRSRSRPVVRFERSVLTAIALLGDLALIAAQLTLGLVFHGQDPLAVPAYTVETVAPFLIGWLLVAPLLGLYASRTYESVPRSVLAVCVAWTVAALIGAAIRASPYVVGNAPPTFVAVTVGTGLALLVPWRAALAAVVGR